MPSVSISEAKNRLSQLLERVKRGETVTILDRGVPVARLESVAPVSEEALAALERTGVIHLGSGDAKLDDLPWPKIEASAVRTLLAEREGGR
jgi:prevent-host-death family protein